MNYIQKELQNYVELADEEAEKFLFLLKEKGFLQPDNSLQILLKMFEASYAKGRKDVFKELAENLKEATEEF